MAKINDILSVSGHMVDCRLEPDDETKYLVTVTNKSDCYTANNIAACLALKCGPVPGIEVTPNDRYFGTLGPGGCETKEIVILTSRAELGKYEIGLHLDFTVSYENCECEYTCFEVTCD